MQDFLLLFRAQTEVAMSYSPEDMQADVPKWQAWMAQVAQEGQIISSKPLSSTSQIVRNNALTDGPFAEVKELVMGYLVCAAPDMATAIRFAQSCPVQDMPHGNVEVRAIISMGGPKPAAS